ncbi:universal stress protein [Luteithermobacter gelatinilyticus]|uniref:universal stress protein n=1 Tax=Luteithermobacter gelatinilyticus TaxID=2582913 RepID=UPI001107310C|nr:universal stress protein [Luteithermobacter gelatinilyticus]
MKKILVIADRLPDQPSLAYDKALFFAERAKVSVHVLSVVHDSLYEQQELISNEQREALKDTLISREKYALSKLLEGKNNITGEVQWNKSLIDAVEKACAKEEFDLIIKTGHRSETLFHRPSDFHLLTLPKIPVLILHAHRWRSKRVVLATVDFSNDDEEQMALNDKVLTQARYFADLLDASLHCSYVITYNPALADLDIINTNEMQKRFKEKRLKKLQDYVAKYGIPPENIHIKAGKANKVIPSQAGKLHAELVVLGTHRRKGLSRIVLGSTCEKILKILRTDILAIKPD